MFANGCLNLACLQYTRRISYDLRTAASPRFIKFPTAFHIDCRFIVPVDLLSGSVSFSFKVTLFKKCFP